jgi:hypothetical protein
VKQFSRREQADDLTLLVTKAYSSSAGDSAP